MPEPADLATALLPPRAQLFRADLSVLQAFVAGAEADWQAAAMVLMLTLGSLATA